MKDLVFQKKKKVVGGYTKSKKKWRKREDLVNQRAGLGQGKEIEAGDSFFERLPDDLIVFQIFDKITDAKSLCRCLLVSKHFSSLVYKAHHVSVKIPVKVPYHEFNPTTPRASFPGKLVYCLTMPLGYFPSLLLPLSQRCPRFSRLAMDFEFIFHLATKFVGKFTSLKSLHVEFEFSDLDCTEDEPVIKWKMDSKSASFIFLIAPRSVDDASNTYARNFGLLNAHYDCHLAIAFYTFHLMETLFPSLPESLLSVVIMDSKNRGKLDIGETDLVQMRNQLINSSRDGDEKERIRFMDAPLLEFPSSGYPADIVDLFLPNAKENKNAGHDDADDVVVRDAFQGKQGGIVEAVMELLKQVRAGS